MRIAQGAEAIIRKEESSVIKERVPKAYRLPQIDERLRKHRTRREAKILEALAAVGFPAPRVKNVDDKNMLLEMDFVEGPLLKDVLHEKPEIFAKEIGRKVGLMHSKNIIHSDLTTSNMILKNGEIHFIDFGLSFFSGKAEDKAVDLHLLDRALESKHHEVYEQCIKAVIEGYKEAFSGADEVLDRLETKVQLRGRNKRKKTRSNTA